MNHALWLEGWLVTATTETKDARIAEAVYAPLPSTCLKCGSVDRLYRHGVKSVDYVDTPSAGKRLIIRAQVKRFRCRDCFETSMQPLPDMVVRNHPRQGGPDGDGWPFVQMPVVPRALPRKLVQTSAD